jgi:hypothetical protein
MPGNNSGLSSGSGPNCFQALGSSPSLLRGPILCIGGPSSPTGTAAAECPGEEKPSAWEAPAAQISTFPKEPHRRRAADDSLTAKKPQTSNFVRLEIEIVKGRRRQGPWPPPQRFRSAPQGFIHSRSWLAHPLLMSCKQQCGDNTGNRQR